MDIKAELQKLITDSSTKEQIEQVAIVSKGIDDLIAESEKQKADYKELLGDYAGLVKSNNFKVDNPQKHDDGVKEFSFESFAKDWQNK